MRTSTDRYVDVADSDIVLDVVAYGSCTSEPAVVVTYDVTFQVDMNGVDMSAVTQR